MKNTFFIISLFSLVFCSCSAGFDPVDYGHDACSFCKMTIMDKRYAAEILTAKGKAYKFDDISCLKKYIKEQNLPQTDLKVFIADYNSPGKNFIDAYHAVYLHNEIFKSAMNGGFAAFQSTGDAKTLADSLHTGLLKWEDLQ